MKKAWSGKQSNRETGVRTNRHMPFDYFCRPDVFRNNCAAKLGQPASRAAPPPSEAPLRLRHSLAEPGEMRWEPQRIRKRILKRDDTCTENSNNNYQLHGYDLE